MKTFWYTAHYSGSRIFIFQPTWENIAHEMFLCEYHKDYHHKRELVEYYNIKEDEIEEEDDLRKNNINESEGFREV